MKLVTLMVSVAPPSKGSVTEVRTSHIRMYMYTAPVLDTLALALPLHNSVCTQLSPDMIQYILPLFVCAATSSFVCDHLENICHPVPVRKASMTVKILVAALKYWMCGSTTPWSTPANQIAVYDSPPPPLLHHPVFSCNYASILQNHSHG